MKVAVCAGDGCSKAELGRTSDVEAGMEPECTRVSVFGGVQSTDRTEAVKNEVKAGTRATKVDTQQDNGQVGAAA